MKKKIRQVTAWLLATTMAFSGGMSHGISAWADTAGSQSALASPSNADDEEIASASDAGTEEEDVTASSSDAVKVSLASASDSVEYTQEFLTAEGIRITIESDDSIWSDETTIEVTKVNSSDVTKMNNLVTSELGENQSVSAIYAYDITFYDDGEEFKPDGTIKVTFSLPEDLADVSSEAEIFHVNDAVTKADLMETTEEEENTWSCIADGFSVYGIAVTSVDYIGIYTVEDLQNISNDLTGTYYLMNDIDLSGVEWTPIGDGTTDFSGVFNGQNYTISNLSIPYNENLSYYGLFGVASGSIENVSITNLDIRMVSPTQNLFIGGIAASSSGTINNCKVTGEIYVTNSDNNIRGGGFVGYGEGTYNNLESKTDITILGTESSHMYIGGIVGSGPSETIDCINYGDITVIGGNNVNVGGITGYSSYLTFSSCINYGNIAGTMLYFNSYSYGLNCCVGGICGQVSRSGVEFIDCINFGNITALGKDDDCDSIAAGGILADEKFMYISQYVVLNNCFNLGAEIICTGYRDGEETACAIARVTPIRSYHIKAENVYSLDSTLVNGEIITDEDMPRQGESLSFAEMKALLYELYGLEIDGEESSIPDGIIYYLIGYEIQDDRLYLNDLLGKGFAITGNTDTSFIEDIENWCGKYVYVVTDPDSTGEENAPDNLISVSLLDTKAGLVSAVTEDAITIDGVEYAFTDGCGVSEELVNQRVLIQVLNGVVVSVETLTEKTGTLVSYDAENSIVKVKSESETEYSLSCCMTEEDRADLSAFAGHTIKYYVDAQNLVCIMTSIQNPNGFALGKDGWSFINSNISFSDSREEADEYIIPMDIYNQVYGKAYMDSHTDIFETKWYGNCFGMCASAALFYYGELDWNNFVYDNNDFEVPNNYYESTGTYLLNDTKYYYASAGRDSRITHLIERYQLYEDGISYSEKDALLNETFFTKTGFFSQTYDILSKEKGGVYIENMLEQLKEAYANDSPVLVSLQIQLGAHGLVTRTDKEPSYEGNGWWKVYVYDPNYPYVSDNIIEDIKTNDETPEFLYWANEKDEDIYLELNPSLNKWRYHLGFGSADGCVGCTPSGDIKYKTVDQGLFTQKTPEYFCLFTLEELMPDDNYEYPHLNTFYGNSDNSEIRISFSDRANLTLTNGSEVVAGVDDGQAGVVAEYGYGVSNASLIGESVSNGGGRMILTDLPYVIAYYGGDVILIGYNNIISISTADETEEPNEAITMQFNLKDNSITMTAGETAREISVKCSHLYSEDDCVYVTTSGTLEAGKTLSLSLSENEEITAETDGDLPFDLYKNSVDSDVDVYMITVPSTDDTDIDNNDDSEQDVESDSQDGESGSGDSSSTDGSVSESTSTGNHNSSDSDSDDDESGSFSGSTVGSWILDHIGWWFQHQDGSYPAGEWRQLVWNGNTDWYYFKPDGYMATGWFTDTDGNKYYLNPVSDGTQGRMLTGWQLIDGKWYYFNEVSDGTKGALLTNRKVGEYFVDEDGVRTE